MKNIKKILGLVLFSFVLSFSLSAQLPPHPDNDLAGGGTDPANGGPIGGAAGLAGGIGVLLALSGVYGAKKVYKGWKKLND